MKNIIRILVACVAALAGCGEITGNSTPLVSDAWREAAGPVNGNRAAGIAGRSYGMPGLPEIHWYGGAGLDCPGDSSMWYDPKLDRTAELAAKHEECPPGDDVCDGCFAGQYRGGVALVSESEDGMGWRRALAHEILHNFYDVTTGDHDYYHANPGWEPGGLLDQAVQAIESSGY